MDDDGHDDDVDDHRKPDVDDVADVDDVGRTDVDLCSC
jgi:hypothetical protein